MLVALVLVAAGGISLPDFDESVRNRAAVVIQHATRDNNALAERRRRVLTRKIVVRPRDGIMAVHGTGYF
jgi:hypothetical protein